MKFPTPSGIGEVLGNLSYPELSPPKYIEGNPHHLYQDDTKGRRTSPLAREELIDLDGINKRIRLGATLSEKKMLGMKNLLIKYINLFAWSPNDMPRINTDIISHELTIDLTIRMVTF